MHRMSAAVGAAVLAVLPLAASPSAAQPAADVLVLPAPIENIPAVNAPLIRIERLRVTRIPGPVRNSEEVLVGLAADGTPAALSVTQRITLTGRGDFVVRERAAAVDVTALDDTTAPVLQRGAVVWQGFVPGRKELAARIELDPLIESGRLPLGVTLSFRPAAGGPPVAVGTDGRLPGAGTLSVRLTNQTALAAVVPTGVTAATALVAPLQRLQTFASGPPSDRPPVPGAGLPTRLPATGVGERQVAAVAGLRVSGQLRVVGAGAVTTSGPGVVASGETARVAGLLAGTAEFTVQVPAAGRLALDLAVRTAVDPRRLRPPQGATWAAWAASRPTSAERRAAVDVLVDAATVVKRNAEITPYLGEVGPGPTQTVFRYALAPPPRIAPRRAPLTPRPGAIAVACLAVVAIAGNAVAIWRRL